MAEPRERRSRGWLRGGMAILFGAIGIWIAYIATVALGAEPVGTALRSGTATIVSCSRSPVDLWTVNLCTAEVTWDRQREYDGVVPWQPIEWKRSQVVSARDLSGSLRVEEFAVGRGRGRSPAIQSYPVDRPHWALGSGGIFMFNTLVSVSFAAIGFLVGRKVDSLLPEPREPVKNWRGVDRKQYGPRRMPGRKRRKR